MNTCGTDLQLLAMKAYLQKQSSGVSLRLVYNEERWPDGVVPVDDEFVIVKTSPLLSKHLGIN